MPRILRRFFRNLAAFPRQFLAGLKNCIRYAPLVWADRDFDYAYLLALMSFKLDAMSRHIARHDRHVGSQKIARELKICAHICRRLENDNYFQNLITSGERHGVSTKLLFEEAARVKRADLELFGKLFRKVDCWWD